MSDFHPYQVTLTVATRSAESALCSVIGSGLRDFKADARNGDGAARDSTIALWRFVRQIRKQREVIADEMIEISRR